ncbi:aldolase [Pantoea rwandensis]|uniref:3-oxo-tetronate 4-phosphate decarboxylase n=1 Tax=Pantoea rwandensis TaxID=1076550 RepID=A0A1X1D2Z4_9GAMM|nr:aldolase [Pantoea rwandensis]ORM71062.1 aldolase [Pantoea rwandensis]
MSHENTIREEICQTGHSLHRRGYTVGSSGNISAKLEDGWLITPTDVCLGSLRPDMIAKVNLEGEWVNGGKPSKTLKLHRTIYENNDAVRGIVHTHSTHLVAMTLGEVWSKESILPPITPYQVMKVGRIPLISYCRPGSPDVAVQAGELAHDVKGIMLERLGPVIWGTSVTKAAEILEELEETAKLWLMTHPKPESLSQPALQDLFDTFDCRW